MTGENFIDLNPGGGGEPSVALTNMIREENILENIYYKQTGIKFVNKKLKSAKVDVSPGQFIIVYGEFAGVRTYGIYINENGKFVSSIQEIKNTYLTVLEAKVRAFIVPEGVSGLRINLLADQDYLMISNSEQLEDGSLKLETSFDDSIVLYNALPKGKHIPGTYYHHDLGFLGNRSLAWYPPIKVSGFKQIYFDDFADNDGGLTSCGTWFDQNWNQIGYEAVERTVSSAIITVPESAFYFIPTVELNVIEKCKLLRVKHDSNSNFLINSEYVYSTQNNSPFESKTWVSFGDSITAYNTWQPFVSRHFKLKHINHGVRSATMAGNGQLSLNQENFINKIVEANPDIITILVGANDLLTPEITLGTVDEIALPKDKKDRNTFYGAYSYLIETLLEWKPMLRIFILGTGFAYNNGLDVRPEGSTLTYTDFSEACRRIASCYGLPFVDLHGEAGFNKFTMGSPPFDVYSNDGIHPNAAGARRIADLVIGCFERTINTP